MGQLKLILKLLIQAVFIYIAVAFLIVILFKLNKLFNIAKKLSINFKLHVCGKTINVPMMGESLIMSALASLLLGFASAIFYKYYFTYKYEKEKLQPKITNKKNFSYKALAIGAIYLSFNDPLSGLLDEVNTSLSTTLKGVNVKDKFLWVMYCLILLTLFIGNVIEIWKIKAIFNIALKDDSIENDNHQYETTVLARTLKCIKKKTKRIGAEIFTRRSLIKIGLTLLLSLILLFTSFGVSRLPAKLTFEWRPEVHGQVIEIFSNKNNMLFALFFPMLLFVIFYNYVFPAFDKKPDNKKEICFEKVKGFFKNFAFIIRNNKETYFEKAKALSTNLILTIINTIAMSFFISSVNTLQDADFSNVSTLIPLVLLIFSSIVFTFTTAKQFEKKDEVPSSKGSYGISGEEFDEVLVMS